MPKSRRLRWRQVSWLAVQRAPGPSQHMCQWCSFGLARRLQLQGQPRVLNPFPFQPDAPRPTNALKVRQETVKLVNSTSDFLVRELQCYDRPFCVTAIIRGLSSFGAEDPFGF